MSRSSKSVKSWPVAEIDRTGALWSCTYLGGSRGRSVLFLRVHHSHTDGVGGIELLDAMLDTERKSPPRDLGELPLPQSDTSAQPLAIAGVTQKVLKMQADVVRSAVAASRHPVDSGTTVWQGLQSTVTTVVTRLIGVIHPDGRPQLQSSHPRVRSRARTHARSRTKTRLHDQPPVIRWGHRRNHAVITPGRITSSMRFEYLCRSVFGPTTTQPAGTSGVRSASLHQPTSRIRLNGCGRCAPSWPGLAKSPALEFGQSLAGAVQLLPSVLSSNIVSGMMRGVDVVITNIPGLQEDRFLGGARVDRVYAFAPTAGAALSVALVSHHGRACVGVLSDRAAIADPPRSAATHYRQRERRDLRRREDGTDPVRGADTSATGEGWIVPKVVSSRHHISRT